MNLNDPKTFQVVIPCFNESEGLPELLEAASKIAVEENGEFVIVENGSNDSSAEILKRCELPGIRPVFVKQNTGYGNGILEGLKYCTAPYIGWTHADLQTPLTDIPKAVHLLSRNFGFVKGRRINRGLANHFFSLGMGAFESILFQKKLYEINAQPTLFGHELKSKILLGPKDFSLDLFALVLARKSKLRIYRFPVKFEDRKYGVSSWNFNGTARLRFILRTIKYSFTLRKSINDYI